MTRPKWLNPSSLRFAIGFAVFLALLNGVWILLEHKTPAWDQANYLWVTLQYKAAFAGGDVLDLARSILHTDPARGPLFMVLMLPLMYITGPNPDAGLLLNLLIAPVLYVAAGEIAYIAFRNWTARLLTIFLVATMPIIVGLQHEVLQDFLLITLCTLSLLLLLKTERFQRRGMTLALGLTMGLGTVTKVTFPVFLAGPLLVVAAQAIAERRGSRPEATATDPSAPDRKSAGWLGLNLAGAAVLYLLVTVPWFGPNLKETIEYLESTTGGTLAEGAGPTNPLTFDAIGYFTTAVTSANISLVLVLAGLTAVALNGSRIKDLFTKPLSAPRLFMFAFLLTWVVIPYLLLVTGSNQDIRLMAPAMPGVAVLIAGAVSLVRWSQARRVLIGILVVFPAFTVLNHTIEIDPSPLPNDVAVNVAGQIPFIRFSSGALGSLRLPEKTEYAGPVLDYVEETAERLPGGAAANPNVCILQSEAVVNGNTFRYLGSARESPLGFYEILAQPYGESLKTALERCNFALYVPQPKSTSEDRVTLVNEQYAASRMTPELLRIFKGPRKTFPTETADHIEGENIYLTVAGRPNQVQVLVRDPIGHGVANP